MPNQRRKTKLLQSTKVERKAISLDSVQIRLHMHNDKAEIQDKVTIENGLTVRKIVRNPVVV